MVRETLESFLQWLAGLPRLAGVLAFLLVFTQFGTQTTAMTAVYSSAFVASVVVAFDRSRPLTLGVASVVLGWSAFNVFRNNDQVVAAFMAIGAVAGAAWAAWIWRKLDRARAEREAEPENGVGSQDAGGHWLPESVRMTEIQRELSKPGGIDWLVVGTWLATLATIYSSLQLSDLAAAPRTAGGRSDYGAFLGIDFRAIMLISSWVAVLALLTARKGLRRWLRWTIALVALAVALVDTVASQIGPSTGGAFPPALPWAAVGSGLLLIGLEVLEADGLRDLLFGDLDEAPA